MYPQEELTLLAAQKAVLRQRIFERRAECAAAIARVAHPLEWIDRALGVWRKLSPLMKLAVVPLGLVLKRWMAPRARVLGTVLRWGPLVYAAVRGFNESRKLSHRS
jgi:hypothetical protein